MVATSDWHGELPGDSVAALPEGDVLVIAGDIMPVWNHNRQYQAAWFRQHFLTHLAGLPYEEIIFVGGNHDFVLQDSPALTNPELNVLPPHVHYLEDSCVHIGGVCFYGIPWTPPFGNWAFMLPEHEIEERLMHMQSDIDVLVTHGPPRGILDRTEEGVHAGSKALLRAIEGRRPWHVVCGHIHEAYGTAALDPDEAPGGTTIHNVSLMNRRYTPINPAQVFECSAA